MLGNHELVRGSIADFHREMSVPATPPHAGRPPALLLNSGIEGLPMTQWRGRIGPIQLHWLDQQLSESPDTPTLVFSHHPLQDTVYHSDAEMMRLDDSAEVRARPSKASRSGRALQRAQSFPERLRLRAAEMHRVSAAGRVAARVSGGRHRSNCRAVSTVRLFDSPGDSPDPKAADPAYRRLGEGGPADQTGEIRFA